MNELTRESLQIAFVSILRTKSFDKISVTELTKLAGVSRMAYYRNYDSMIDLFHDVLDFYFKSFLNQGKQFILDGQWYKFWVELFNYIYQYQDEIKVILNNNHHTEVLEYLNQAFTGSTKNIQERYLILCMIGIAFNVLIEWMRNDFDIAPTELATLCLQFTNQDMYVNNHPRLPDKYLNNDS